VNNWIRKAANQCFRLMPAVLIVIHMLGPSAMASDNSVDWRAIYDNIMIWVNFFILAYVIYYFGRKPFMDFLKGREKEVSEDIRQLEERKKTFEDQIQETEQMIKDSSSRFEKIKSRITEEGERKRQQIINQANEQSRKLLEMEKKKAANQIVQARQLLMAELADTASDLALDRLPKEINEADQENMLSLYIHQIAEYAEKAG